MRRQEQLTLSSDLILEPVMPVQTVRSPGSHAIAADLSPTGGAPVVVQAPNITGIKIAIIIRLLIWIVFQFVM